MTTTVTVSTLRNFDPTPVLMDEADLYRLLDRVANLGGTLPPAVGVRTESGPVWLTFAPGMDVTEVEVQLPMYGYAGEDPARWTARIVDEDAGVMFKIEGRVPLDVVRETEEDRMRRAVQALPFPDLLDALRDCGREEARGESGAALRAEILRDEARRRHEAALATAARVEQAEAAVRKARDREIERAAERARARRREAE